jgi:MFS family permease
MILSDRCSSGNEIGPFRAVEESTLAHLTSHELLSDVFAWYSLIGTAGSALGMLVCGWIINSLESIHGWPFIPACRIIFFVYAGVGVVKLLFTLGLSSKVEVQEQEQSSETRPLLVDPNAQQAESTPKKKSIFPTIEKDLWSLVIRLFILFGVDSFASGLASLWVSPHARLFTRC